MSATQVFEGAESSDEEEDGGMTKKRRNKKNRYGMTKTSGRRFRAERMNIFGMRKTTEFSIDEVCRVKLRAKECLVFFSIFHLRANVVREVKLRAKGMYV